MLGADNRSGPCFPICLGTLPWQPNNVGRNNECRLILPVFFALVFENELEYHYLYVRINRWASDQYLQSSRESTVYNKHLSALAFVYLRLPGGRTVMFRYYLLGGDTAAPTGYMLGFAIHF